MKITRISIILAVILSISSIAIATDYKPDTTYPDFGFTSTDVVYDVFVHPDGRYLVAGEDFTSGNSVPFLKRYFANGTLDGSFTAGVTTVGGSQNQVTHIMKLLPNGQYLVRGRFTAGTFGYWARLNSNGSLDSTVPLNTINAHLRGVQDDGELLFCGPRTENGITYNTLFRRNADTTFDPTFQITFADTGVCPEAYPLPDGKILVAGPFQTGGQDVKQLQRLNADGSVDPTFTVDVTAGSNVRVLIVLADGKILISNSSSLKLLNPDGSIIRTTPNCASSFAVQMADGSFMANNCRKVAGSQREYDILQVKTDGTVDQSMDWLAVSGFEGLKGFREDGTGGFYVYGGISQINGFNRRGLIRVVPFNTPPKAKFDFDGDGKSDLAVYRPGQGVWYLNQSTAGFRYRQWGLSTDNVAAADADLDGKTDIGVFRNGAWHALTSSNDWHMYMCLGAAGDEPLVGVLSEYYGIRDFASARGSRSGNMNWFINGAYTNCWMNNQQPQPKVVPGETATDIAVTGDFNGDSRDEIGYFRDGYWYGVDIQNFSAPTSTQWGIAGDIPVPGDYDGDRQTDYAIYRPSTGAWWINRSSLGAIAITFGISTDIPVPADYDGDGKADVAIYRNGQWWQFLSADSSVVVQNWGIAGDIPIPAQAQ